MGVRKTESRIPANFKPDDLGEKILSSDERCALISYITSPLVVDRENVYVVFVTDIALIDKVFSFEWTFTENDGVPNTEVTEHGEISYRPKSLGNINLVVRVLDSNNNALVKLSLNQQVISLNPELESLIASAQDKPYPAIFNPSVSRELINDYNFYYQTVGLQTAENESAFKRLLFSLVYDGALQDNVLHRTQYLEKLATTINNQESDFALIVAKGLGVCNVRLALLAMTLPKKIGDPNPLLNWTELPESSLKHTFADEKLRQSLADLDQTVKIDLFNLVRFPKSNIAQCGRILEVLRNRYFNQTSFDDVLVGMSGTRANWIIRNFREGPIARN
jgi:hypothetical protein